MFLSTPRNTILSNVLPTTVISGMCNCVYRYLGQAAGETNENIHRAAELPQLKAWTMVKGRGGRRRDLRDRQRLPGESSVSEEGKR